MASTTGRSTTPPVVATTNDGVLPLDLLFDILSRLSAETIGRFRAVCRSWRSLLRHPDFITAARNTGPLIAIGLRDQSYASLDVNVVDLETLESGKAIKRVKVATTDLHGGGGFQLPTGQDRLVCCVVGRDRRLRLIDLTIGAASLLPAYEPPPQTTTTYTLGHAKLLAISTPMSPYERQICKILALDGSGWRDAPHPPLKLEWQCKSIAVIDSIAYCLSYRSFSPELRTQKIMAFNLDTETWRPLEASLRGPYSDGRHCDCLVEMDGQLVAGRATSMEIELWFLVVELDKSYWSKRYTINMPYIWNLKEYFLKPLALLDDGRIVLWMRVDTVHVTGTESNYLMRIYDPRTKTLMDDGTRVPCCSRVSVFKWNLLDSRRRGVIDLAVKGLLKARRHHQSGAPSSTRT